MKSTVKPRKTEKATPSKPCAEKWRTAVERKLFMGIIFFSSCQKHCSSYIMAFKIKVVTEAEAVENNLEIARDYGLGESMVQRWGRVQAAILSGELIC